MIATLHPRNCTCGLGDWHETTAAASSPCYPKTIEEIEHAWDELQRIADRYGETSNEARRAGRRSGRLCSRTGWQPHTGAASKTRESRRPQYPHQLRLGHANPRD